MTVFAKCALCEDNHWVCEQAAAERASLERRKQELQVERNTIEQKALDLFKTGRAADAASLYARYYEVITEIAGIESDLQEAA
jgi:hypothetical protein